MADLRARPVEEVRWDAPEIVALLEEARERGFVEMSALQELVERLELERDVAAWLGGQPTVDETAEAAGFSPEQVQEMRDIARAATSLHRPVGEEGETTLGALLREALDEPALRREIAAAA